jgi:hypothetical protein
MENKYGVCPILSSRLTPGFPSIFRDDYFLGPGISPVRKASPDSAKCFMMGHEALPPAAKPRNSLKLASRNLFIYVY